MVASAGRELLQGQCQHITCMRPRTRSVWSLCVRLLWLQGGLSTPPPHHRTDDRWASIPRPQHSVACSVTRPAPWVRAVPPAASRALLFLPSSCGPVPLPESPAQGPTQLSPSPLCTVGHKRSLHEGTTD